MDELAMNTVPGLTAKLSDYVVMTILGDLPKNSYTGRGTGGSDWRDGTVAAANWIYVMSNNFLKPGWFGKYLPRGKVNFDGATGLLDKDAAGVERMKANPAAPGIEDSACTNAALAAMLYAVARGNTAKVRALVDRPYEGLINKP